MTSGRDDGSDRGWRRPALAAALLLLAACASEHPAPINCGVDPKQRPLGARTGPFLEWLGDWPHLAGKEVGDRSAMLGDDWKSYSGRFHDDASASGEHVRNFGSFTANECSTHGTELENFFESQGDRMREDAHCFFARAWHSLKLIE
ncbi:MAG TPA: hypothetical protein VFG37_04100 [Planctomycetota bacterium]|nr:hypothetical protein [Planctomycetota bacterium]